ncbi:MAG: septal ring lytic transglycosylase RlpA family protein [Rhodospirillales bacterium]|nr:septal ring lytic transglycosylase RlpA family protein [Rhodospirillales bacterium]MSP81228.1 septal ring lytic transglycosylase RlpA family protein [Rhodospirillales bacterium]
MRDGPAGGVYKVGEPYQINGVWYTPVEDYRYDETGIASWYGADFHGKATANGETYDMNEVTAAHKTLPMPSLARVTNLENGRSLIVRVNDRGPFVAGRIVDLSRRSAQLLGLEGQGTGKVRVQILPKESLALAERLKERGAVANARALPRPEDAKDKTLMVAQLPKAEVAQENLAPLPGAKEAPQQKPTASRAAVTDTPLSEVVAVRPDRGALSNARGGSPAHPAAKVGTLTQGAARATRIYVQAGAYGNFDNANKTGARLAKMGPVAVSPVLVQGRDVFRVRIGPIDSVEEADRFLDRMIRSGYPDARVVVD